MTGLAGVNLRVEDVEAFKRNCATLGTDPESIPVLAILHDDTPDLLAMSLRVFAGLRVAAYRCMAENSQLVLRAAADGGLPQGSHVIAWNEKDGQQGWWDSWWKQCRSQRPDLVIHYGAPNVNNEWPLNEALASQLDVVDQHIGATFGPPPASIAGKPVWVTEIDVDQSHPETATQIPQCMRACLDSGIPAFAWGADPSIPDVVYDLDLLSAILAISNEWTYHDFYGGTDMAQAGSTQGFVIGPGFAQRIMEQGLIPLSNETYFSPDLSICLTDKGPLWYSKTANQVVGPFGTAAA